LGPDAKPPGPEPETATRFVLRVRLNMLTDEISRNLSPKSIASGSGEVPAPAAEALARVIPKLEKLVAEIVCLVERKEINP
jgi:hypothetical protein